jgi:cellulose synthase/poly-beta-1,6-N-acetylglucosamine synthase-like glycosyltransferase
MILEFVVFYAVALVITTLAALIPGVIGARAPVSVPVTAVALAIAAGIATIILRDSTAAAVLGLVAVIATAAMRALQPRWSWSAAQVFTTMVLASVSYLGYAAVQTYAGGLAPDAEILSTALLVLEIAVLAISMSYTFEVLDVLGRQDPPLVRPASQTLPWVALQVPTYNEPSELVIRTRESLARIEYPHLLIQVVDNNTKDPALWRPLQEACERLGPTFQFLHLDPWPGFKAGALNEATRRLPSEIEVIGIVDADYIVEPTFLQATIGHFDDPRVAFVQTSQHYREWKDDRYLRGLFYSFRYFFDVTMPVRAHRNAIIFCGTMGLIRRSAIDQIGGWNETCITEDAEASLRILGRGHLGVYDPAAYGAGLMPLSFDGLKKQRFRWALGGVQILRQWWRELVPFTTHHLKLTRAQRLHYLLGSVQWFGEVLTACFTLLLLATALATALHHHLPLRQLTGAVLVVPLAFASTGLLRALWAMRLTTGCSAGDALRAMRVWFALSWVVTLACLQGLVKKRAEFLRTPKRRDDEGTLLRALRFARTETLLAGCAVGVGVAMDLRSPGLATAAFSVLLVNAAVVYSSASWASLAAEGIPLTPLRRIFAGSPQNTGDRPALRPATAAVGGAAAGFAAGMGVALAFVVGSPSASAPPSGGGSTDLPKIGSLTPSIGLPGPRPSPADSPRPVSVPVPTAAASPSLGPLTGGTPSPGTLSTVSPTSSPAPSPSPSPSSIPSPSPTVRPSPTARPSTTPAGTPTPATSPTPRPTTPPTPSPSPSPRPTATARPASSTPTPTA